MNISQMTFSKVQQDIDFGGEKWNLLSTILKRYILRVWIQFPGEFQKNS